MPTKDAAEFPVLDHPAELLCLQCHTKGKYDIGTFLIAPQGKLEDVGFTGCVRCRGCNSTGPWSFDSTKTGRLVSMLMMRLIAGDKDVPVVFGDIVAFDGHSCRYGGEMEDYLLSLIEREPNRAFLRTRLGNLYARNKFDTLAISSFEKATELDETDIEAWYGLATLYRQGRQSDKALHSYRQVTVYAESATGVEPKLLKHIVQHARTVVFGSEHFPGSLNGLPLDRSRVKVGRNEFCPCGSGSKYKKCCALAPAV